MARMKMHAWEMKLTGLCAPLGMSFTACGRLLSENNVARVMRGRWTRRVTCKVCRRAWRLD